MKTPTSMVVSTLLVRFMLFLVAVVKAKHYVIEELKETDDGKPSSEEIFLREEEI